MSIANAQENQNVAIIAHRGFSGTENSLEAIEKAWQSGADIVEIDVRLLSDGELALFHDNALRGRSVDRLTLKSLRALSPRKRIATLQEALAKTPDNKSILLDVKNLPDRLVEILREEITESVVSFEHVLIQSKNLRTIQEIKRTLPEITALLVVSPKSNELHTSLAKAHALSVAVANNEIDGISMKYGSYFTAEHAEAFTSKGLLLFVWTVNRGSKMDRLIETQVTGIITDKTDLLKKKIEQSKREQDSALNSYSSLRDESS